MRKIPLTQGKVALVDNDDFERVSQFKWFAVRGKVNVWYARRSVWSSSKKRDYPMPMHRFILNAGRGTEIDHQDLNGLNNQKGNLRFCSKMQQSANRRVFRKNKTGLKGVVWHKRDLIFEAAIRVRGKLIYLGRFENKMDAAKAYDGASIKYFGDFARTNG